ncbi:MAG: glycosyl hydrolase family 18 protein [Johnsonella sp.]|nr:glycosyl hydrolase family 18 protein [Johnsonella sp.]
MKKIKPLLLIIVFMLFISGISYLILRFSEDLLASRRRVEEVEYFDASGDKVAIIYNYGLQAEKALYREGKIYIPIVWVRAILNDKFYWSEEEDLLIYTTPTDILYSDLSSRGSDGKLYILKEGEKAYLSVDLIRTYTDIYTEEYIQGEVKRIFIGDQWEDHIKAEAEKEIKLRAGDSKKTDIVRELQKQEEVLIASEEETGESIKEGWLKVKTADGFFGFVEKKHLREKDKLIRISSFEQPIYSNIRLEEPIVLGWHQVGTKESNKGLGEIIKNSPGLNVISPTWFSLSDNRGNYTSLANGEYVKEAHANGLQVWVLIDNFSKEVNSEILFASTPARAKLIENLIADVKKYDIDGINLDFESLKEEAASHYIQFIREISTFCRREGIVLSVDLPVPAPYNTFYGRKKQAEVADYLIVMGYDEHYAGGEMGSVSSYPFVKQGIEDSLKEIPKEKLINAIPFYTRLWTKTSSGLSSKALGIRAATDWIEENSVELRWDEALGQYYGEFEEADGKSHLWMEEEKSLGLKVDLINKNDLAGVAIWKLGLETPQLWKVIERVR